MPAHAHELNPLIVNKILRFQKEPLLRDEIMAYEPKDGYLNEFLFFIKPEITRCGERTLIETLTLIFNTMNKHHAVISGIAVLGARYLEQYDLMSRHYGVINAIAREGKSALSDKARAEFTAIYGKDITQTCVFGGFEFLQKYDYFNEQSLNVLWEAQSNQKLASGTYCQKVKIFEEEIFLLNGFHPYQLFHYTRQGASIVVFNLQSSTDWKILRRDMIGETDPHKANAGSIRRVLLERKNEWDITEISQGNNGVHLSAGPVEALAETIRFSSDHAANQELAIGSTAVGRSMLQKGIPERDIGNFLQNSSVHTDGRTVKVFDLTEEMNTNECVNILLKLCG